MAFDAFLKIDGIKGDSQDQQHPDEIEVLSFTWGENQTGSPSGSGVAAGKVTFQDFHYISAVHKGSPLLASCCASGKRIASALLSVRKTGQPPFNYIKIALEDVGVSTYAPTFAMGNTAPSEAVSLNFSKITFDYTAQKPDGSAGDVTHFGWDLRQNKQV